LAGKCPTFGAEKKKMVPGLPVDRFQGLAFLQLRNIPPVNLQTVKINIHIILLQP
jgi:hypothetical protein